MSEGEMQYGIANAIFTPAVEVFDRIVLACTELSWRIEQPEAQGRREHGAHRAPAQECSGPTDL